MSWSGQPSPAEATARMHTEMRERDERNLPQGPADDSESPESPWGCIVVNMDTVDGSE